MKSPRHRIAEKTNNTHSKKCSGMFNGNSFPFVPPIQGHLGIGQITPFIKRNNRCHPCIVYMLQNRKIARGQGRVCLTHSSNHHIHSIITVGCIVFYLAETGIKTPSEFSPCGHPIQRYPREATVTVFSRYPRKPVELTGTSAISRQKQSGNTQPRICFSSGPPCASMPPKNNRSGDSALIRVRIAKKSVLWSSVCSRDTTCPPN